MTTLNKTDVLIVAAFYVSGMPASTDCVVPVSGEERLTRRFIDESSEIHCSQRQLCDVVRNAAETEAWSRGAVVGAAELRLVLLPALIVLMLQELGTGTALSIALITAVNIQAVKTPFEDALGFPLSTRFVDTPWP